MSRLTPTPEDMALDLVAELQWVQEGPDWPMVAELRTVALAALRRAIAAERDLAACRTVCDGLAARVAGQSELLTRRAEATPRWEDQPKADDSLGALIADMERRLSSPPAPTRPSTNDGLGAWLADRSWLRQPCQVIEDDGEAD